MMLVKFHYAWLPTLVKTWRPQGSKALIWLQKYQTQDCEKSCTSLVFFSKEIKNNLKNVYKK